MRWSTSFIPSLTAVGTRLTPSSPLSRGDAPLVAPLPARAEECLEASSTTVHLVTRYTPGRGVNR